MSQKIALIGAVTENGLYGVGRGDKGSIPWDVPIDMAFFANTTKGDGNNVIIMSRGMWSALPENRRPLRSRKNVIVTSDPPRFSGVEGVTACANLHEAIDVAKKATQENGDIFVAGGHDMWYSGEQYCTDLFINVVHTSPAVGVDREPVLFRHLNDPTKLWSILS
jgi:dihydrofolate reductase